MDGDNKAKQTVDGWMPVAHAVKTVGGNSCYVTDPELTSWHWVFDEARRRGIHAAQAPTLMARARVRLTWD